MNDPTNEERAVRIEHTLVAYRKAQNGQDTPENVQDITDLLTDLMHYCKREGINLDDELGIAHQHYNEEK